MCVLFCFIPILNPINLFLGSLNNRCTNMGLNGAKICKIKVAGSSGTGTSTGTTLTGTGTSPLLSMGTGTTCPLHQGYRYHFLVSVPIRDFCPENVGF